jgi:hypothetical protein
MRPHHCARFQISTAALLIIQVFWDDTLCPWVSGSKQFKGQGIKEEFLHLSNLEDEGTMFLSECQATLTRQHSVMSQMM